MLINGATIEAAAWPKGTDLGTASSDFDNTVGYPMAESAQKVFNDVSTYPATIADDGHLSYLQSIGGQAVISVKPSQTLSASEITLLQNYVNLVKNAGINATFILWHEMNLNNFPSGAAYVTYFNYYAPTIKASFPLVLDFSSSTASLTDDLNNYYPGDTNVDGIFVDLYADRYAKGKRVDELFAFANARVPPKPAGFIETGVGGSSPLPTQQNWNDYVSYLEGLINQQYIAGHEFGGWLYYNGNNSGAPSLIAPSSGTSYNKVPGVQALWQAANQTAPPPPPPPPPPNSAADFPDWGIADRIAVEISQDGVPLLVNSGILVSQDATPINSGATLTLGPFSVDQLGYEIWVSTLGSSESSQPFLQVDMVWSDSTTGLVIGQETWWLVNSNTLTGNTYRGTGPTKGDTLTINVTSHTASQPSTVQVVVAQNSRIYHRDDWRSYDPVVNHLYQEASGNPASGFLMQEFVTVDPTKTETRMLPLFAGEVELYINHSGSGSITVDIRAVAMQGVIGPGVGTNYVYQAGYGNFADLGPLIVTLPRSVCQLDITNNDTVNTDTSRVALKVKEY